MGMHLAVQPTESTAVHGFQPHLGVIAAVHVQTPKCTASCVQYHRRMRDGHHCTIVVWYSAGGQPTCTQHAGMDLK